MITIAVEGDSDTEMARKLVESANGEVGRLYVANGKTVLDKRIPKYIKAAQHGFWVVFRDSDSQCPVDLKDLLLGAQSVPETFSLRIAHSMTEAWFLADSDNFSKYFGLSRARIATDPDTLEHAKRELINLCARSRKREIKEGVVGRDNKAGPRYVQLLNDFARNHWDPESAALASHSLQGALRSVRSLIALSRADE